MQYRPLVLSVLACLIVAPCGGGVTSAADAGAAKPLHVVMLSGAGEYDSKASLTILKAHLERLPGAGVTCTLLHAKDGSTDVPGLEAVDDADLMIVFCRRWKLDDAPLAHVKKYCASGKPIVGIRTASHAFQTWLAYDKEVQGGSYTGHYGAGPTVQVSVNPAQKDHPILRGVGLLTSAGSLYKNQDNAKDDTILLIGSNGEHTEPVAWTHRHAGGRVFYTSLGQQKDFQDAAYLRLLENAVFWAAKRER